MAFKHFLPRVAEDNRPSSIPIMKGRSILLVIAAGTASAGLAYLGTGLHPIWWCLWLAPISVLALATRLGRGAAFLLAFSAWLLGALNEWNYFTRGIEVPLPLVTIVILVPGSCLRLVCSLRAQLSAPRIVLPRCDRFSRFLGGLRISQRGRLA